MPSPPPGISPDVWEERGSERVGSADELIQALRWHDWSAWPVDKGYGIAVHARPPGYDGPGLRFGPESHMDHLPWQLLPSWWPVNGEPEVVGWEVRFEAEVATLDTAGQPKWLRYRGPQGAPVVIDCPVRCHGALADTSVPLWVSEGVKKSDAIASTGQCAIGLRGVAMWSRKRPVDAGGRKIGPRLLHPQWDHVPLDGRKVIVCFDSDCATNRAVAREQLALTVALNGRGARTYRWPCPALPGLAKCGIDDYLAAGGRLPR